MFHQKMICQILDGIINEMNSLIYDYVKGHPNLVNMHSYKKIVVIVAILVLKALASTHLVT
jgi:hypothetical protein